MTVRELIELLSELPPDSAVLVDDNGMLCVATVVEPGEYPSGRTVLIA